MASFKIILWIVLSSISILFIKSDYTCDNIYRCATSDLQQNQCVYSHPFQDNNTITLHEISLNCDVGLSCPFGNFNNITCSSPVPLNLTDGQACTNNTICASNICTNKKCSGYVNLHQCTNDNQCAIGLACILTENAFKVCTPQKTFNMNCLTSFECANNLVCSNSLCTPYLSLPDGSSASDKLACLNGYLYNGYCVSTYLLEKSDECLSTDSNTTQTTCNYNTTGFSNSSLISGTFKKNCQCSKNFYNRKFCAETDTQNVDWQTYLNFMRDFYTQKNSKLHTVQRSLYDIKLNRMNITLTEYAWYKGADQCAIDIDAPGSFITLSLWLIFLAFTIL